MKNYLFVKLKWIGLAWAQVSTENIYIWRCLNLSIWTLGPTHFKWILRLIGTISFQDTMKQFMVSLTRKEQMQQSHLKGKTKTGERGKCWLWDPSDQKKCASLTNHLHIHCTAIHVELFWERFWKKNDKSTCENLERLRVRIFYPPSPSIK